MIGCARDEVFHHRNHLCASALDPDLDWNFGRVDGEQPPKLRKRVTRDLGPWPETDTPDVGERYVVERMLGEQPQLQEPEKEAAKTTPTQVKKSEFFETDQKMITDEIAEAVRASWGQNKRPAIPKALLPSAVQQRLARAQPKTYKNPTAEMKAEILRLINAHEASLP